MPSRQELISFFALSLATTIIALPLSVSPRTTSSSQGLSSSSSTDRKLLLTRAERSAGSSWQHYSSPDYNTNAIGQQPNNRNTLSPFDPGKHQYSYPAPGPQPIPYPSYPSRDLASSYPINPTESRTLPPITRNELWQHAEYPLPVDRQTGNNIYSSVATSPPTSYPQFSSHQPQQSPRQVTHLRTLPSAPIAGSSTHQSVSTPRRPSSSADWDSTVRTSTHSSSPYARHPHQSDASGDPPQVIPKRKRADAEQLKVLNEVYARTAYPSTEERQDLADRLKVKPRSVQIWFQNKRQSMRHTRRQQRPVQGSGTEPSSATSSHPSTSQQH